MKDMLVVILVVFEGPSCPEDEAFFFKTRRDLAFWKEFESGVGGEYFLKQKIGLLTGKLVGERDGFREGDIDPAFRGEERIEGFGIVLEECFFYILGGRGDEGDKQGKDKEFENCHLKNIITAFLS